MDRKEIIQSNQARRPVGTLTIRGAFLAPRLATLFLVGDTFLSISFIKTEEQRTYDRTFSLSASRSRTIFRLLLMKARGILGTGSIAATTLAGPSEFPRLPQPSFCLRTSESTLGLMSLTTSFLGEYPVDILNGDIEGNSMSEGGGVGGVSLVN